VTREEILRLCDHTLLRRDMSTLDMKRACDEAIEFNTASVCLPPHFVAPARRYAGEGLRICTVIAFPNGYSTTRAKREEAREAVKSGADELDMVINLSMLKDRFYEGIVDEINAVKSVCGERILKVIIETCLLTEDEKIALCRLVSDSKADYIKTSTGFEKGGATREDVALMRKYCAEHIKIKAAGGIATFEDAEDFISLGADRLGTSRLVALAKGF
jgi:deoxyribose-phosphate aldolase